MSCSTVKKSSKLSEPASSSQVPSEYFTFNSSLPTIHQILKAAYMESPSLIIEFFHQGLDLNTPLNTSGWRLLHIASQTGNLALARFLLQNKADVNIAEYTEKWTPLMVAVFNNQSEIVKLLLQHNADVNLTDKDGKSALGLALEYNRTGIFNFLNSKKLNYVIY